MLDVPVILDLTEEEDSALKSALTALDKVRAHNELRLGYYELESRVRQISDVIPAAYYRACTALTWNTRAVDKLAERCTVDGAVWPDGDLDSLGWQQIWRENFLRHELNAGVTSSLLYGPSWMVASQGDTESGEPDVLIHARDASNATGQWDARRRVLKNFAAVTDRDDQGRPSGITILLPGVTVTCTRDETGKWDVDRRPHGYGLTVHPLPFKPLPGRRPFGRSRINRATMQAQDRGVRTLIRLEGLSDIYSFSDLILLGADPSVFTNDRAWSRVMGRWKGLPDDSDADDPRLARAEIHEISPSSPDPHLNAFRLHAGIFSGETSIPMTDLGVYAEANSSSADASENSQQGLVDLADASKDDWTPYLTRLFVDALAMKNGIAPDAVPDEWFGIEPDFRDSRYVSTSAAADAGLKIVQAAPWIAETSVGLKKLGLTPQEIQVAMAEKRRAEGRTAAQALGRTAEAARADAAAR